MPLYDQVELLCQAINTQAQEEAEKISTQAQAEADRRQSDAEGRRQEVLAKTRAEVEAQAKLAARSRIDRAELESKRQISQTKETCLAEIFTQAQTRLQAWRDTPAYGDWLRAGLTAALGQLEGEQFRITANPEEARWLTPDLLGKVSRERACRLELVADPELTPGGFVVAQSDGRVRVDQTFQGLIDRRREALRAEIAGKLWGS
ncbi:MAG: V-type ATP synthase subunit E [Syntrophobacterales bacterium]|jgi:V/A-type H+-transporting ATPase subunit E|nr:V-type ATP synthase subunit E [Syntrophobacterales bacterium]